MQQPDTPFTPESVDEHIGQLLRAAPQEEHASPAHLVQMLQGFYAEDPRLRRVWERLAAYAATTRPTEESGGQHVGFSQRVHPGSSSPLVRFPQERVGN